MWSLLTERPAPEPRLAGLTVGLLRQPPGIGDGRETERSRRGRGVGRRSRAARGAASSRRACPEPSARTPGRSSSTRRCGRTPPRSRAAPSEYGELDAEEARGGAARATPEEIDAAYRAIEEWRRYEPDVDLYVSPCYAIELPEEEADELDVRLPLTSFLRWVNLTGWAGLAIGNMQLIAPRDEVVLAAGLAWERG